MFFPPSRLTGKNFKVRHYSVIGSIRRRFTPFIKDMCVSKTYLGPLCPGSYRDFVCFVFQKYRNIKDTNGERRTQRKNCAFPAHKAI